MEKGTFIAIDFTGRVKESGEIFDTTDEKLAKEADIHNPKAPYGPQVVCLDQGQILPGLEKAIEDHKVGDAFTVEIPPEEGFGKKSAKLVRMIPLIKFRKHQVDPQPGLQVDVDGMNGIVKTVSGGRVLVDFNHPLSGRAIIYETKVERVVEDPKEQAAAVLFHLLGVRDAKITIDGKHAIIAVPMPEQLRGKVEARITELVKGIEKVTFQEEEETQKDK